MSAQLDKIGENGKGYGHLEKVYSIWICLDNIPRKLENTISYYKMQNYKNEGIKDKEFRIDSWESDLLEIIIVRLGGEGQEEKGLLDLLYGLFSGNQKKVLSYWEFERLSDTSKKYILENISNDILENWNLLFEKKKKKHENLREIWFSGYFSLILNSLQYDLKNKEEWKLSFLNYEKILEKDMYAWYEKTTHMCCAFFYDITQIFYIVLAGQEKQIIEADESVTHSIRKIQLFIRRHEDYWKDHVKQKIELEHRLEAML